MAEPNALERYVPPAQAVAHRDPIALGKVLAGSGYFAEAKDAAQAAVKVMAGEELGLGPVAAMTGIHIVQGKVTLSANLIAGLIKRSGRYDYRVARLDGEGCELAFYERGEEIGRSSFTRDDAEAAGLWNKPGPWKQHPRNMFYARAMSNGAKWYCPDVFAGPVYTPDELGAVIDGETGEVIPTPAPSAEPTPPEPEPGPDDLISEGQRRRLFALGKEHGYATREQVKAVVKELTGHDSTTKLTSAQYEQVCAHIKAEGAPAEDQPDQGEHAGSPMPSTPPSEGSGGSSKTSAQQTWDVAQEGDATVYTRQPSADPDRGE
jgi:hypothetical protein